MIKAKPYFPDAYNNLGYLYEQQGFVSKAIYTYKMALQANPDFEKAKVNLETLRAKRNKIVSHQPFLRKAAAEAYPMDGSLASIYIDGNRIPMQAKLLAKTQEHVFVEGPEGLLYKLQRERIMVQRVGGVGGK